MLGDEEPGWRPSAFGYALWGCELALRFPTVKLLDLEPATLERTKNPFATLTLLHRDAQATRGNPAERLRRRASRYRALLRQAYAASDIRILLRLMEHVLRLGSDLAEEARATIRQLELGETGMDTLLTSFEELARAEAQREMVVRQLNRKVGSLNEELQARVASLAPETLLALSDALLDFMTQADLITWLDDQAGLTPR